MAVVRNKGKRLNRYEADYIVFDLETTGLSPATDGIIEISAVKVEDHRIIDRFSSLVNPGMRIPPAATAVNGITNDMVAEAPGIDRILPAFLDFTEDGILVGHNIHTFDTNFIYDASVRLFGKEIRNDYVDTLYMAKSCLPQLPHHRLVDVAAYFKISAEGAHRALNDCLMNQKCYEELGKLLKDPKDAACCPRCGGELYKKKGRFGAFYGCSNYPVCKYSRNI